MNKTIEIIDKIFDFTAKALLNILLVLPVLIISLLYVGIFLTLAASPFWISASCIYCLYELGFFETLPCLAWIATLLFGFLCFYYIYHVLKILISNDSSDEMNYLDELKSLFKDDSKK